MNTTDLLAGFPVRSSMHVQRRDLDAFGHVNHVVYFSWFEDVRVEYFRRVGLFEMKERENIGPLVAAINCTYIRQVLFPDTIKLGARVSRFGKTSFVIQHVALSTNADAVVAESEGTFVVFDYSKQKPCRIPDRLRAEISNLEERPM